MKLRASLTICLVGLAICIAEPRIAGAAPVPPAPVPQAPATTAKVTSAKVIIVTPNGVQNQDGVAAPAGPAHTMNAMLESIKSNDRDGFVRETEPVVKSAMTPVVFGEVTANFGARLRGAYRVTYFGVMKKNGYDVYLWKLAFGAGGDDLLVEMSVKNGLVGGFWFL